MIVFDLRCVPAAHVFEAWFGSSADYEAQQARGLVSCPICGSPEVGKAPMAAAVPAKGGRDAVPMASGGDPAEIKRMLAAVAAMQKKLIEKSEHVGDRFADEARAIHLGEVAARAIHGRATLQEAESLIGEGIAVAPLPFPIAAPGEEN